MFEEKLKKIRAQIKFGRGIEAAHALEPMLDSASPVELQELLPLYVDLQMKRQRFEEAAEAIERGLRTGIDLDRPSLQQKLEECRKEIHKRPTVPDYESRSFREFVSRIPSIFVGAEPANLPGDFIEIKDLEEVARFLHDQNIPAPYFSWNGARSLAAKEVYTECFRQKIDVSRFDNEVMPTIEGMCQKGLSGVARQFFDDVYGDLCEIARGLLVDHVTMLHQRMRAAYDARLFPCGWKGPFPEGRLLISRLW